MESLLDTGDLICFMLAYCIIWLPLKTKSCLTVLNILFSLYFPGLLLQNFHFLIHDGVK